MAKLMWFAIHSTRRVSEITRLLWSDNDADKHTGMVRDLKHPRLKEGNHRRFKYPPAAWEIVEQMPVQGERIFPFNSRTISNYHTRACQMLGIEDLHFHDFRHHGVSLLFEGKTMGKISIPEAQLVTLHESWEEMRTYTNLRPEDI